MNVVYRINFPEYFDDYAREIEAKRVLRRSDGGCRRCQQ